MDFTTLVAGPAQAGPQSPVSKPGIGLTAGAGTGPTHLAGREAGFASLVALALDQMDGAASTAGEAAGTSCHALETGEGAAAVPDADGGDESPLDAPVDAATLSVLIALATPVATPATAQPEVVAGQGDSELAAVDGDVAGMASTAPSEAVDLRAVSRTPAATPAFEGALASAAEAADASVASAPATAEASPAASTPAAIAATATPEAAPTDAVATAPPAAAAAPRAGQRPAAHPLRQALAAMAATTAADTTSTPASEPAATTATPQPAIAIASTPAPEIAGAAGHEGRTAAASRVDAAAAAVAPVAAFAAASDAGAAGDGSTDRGRDGFGAAASTLARAAESRLDLPAAFPASGADPATAVAPSSVAGFGAGLGTTGDTMLRAIDLPAATRFEQTLSSVDPDVRNMQAMVRTVRLFAAGGGAHEARLTLEPEHLGPVALTVRVEQGSVTAHFRAETPAAQRWIETHQQELRAGLREQGLEVKDVVVTTDPDGRRDRRQDAQPARPPRTRRPQDADAPRFEVLV